MSNSLLTVSWITRKAVAMFENSNAFLQMIDRQYEKEFKGDEKIGTTLRIRLPTSYFAIANNQDITSSIESSVEQQVSLVVGATQTVPTSWTDSDLSLSVEDFSDRYLAKMMLAMAGSVAKDVMSMVDCGSTTNAVSGVPNFVANVDGSNNILSPTADTWLQAGAKLDQLSAPRDGARHIVISPYTNARTVSSLMGLFNPTSMIGEQYRAGGMNGNALGVQSWDMDQTVINHTTGAYSTPTNVSGGSQTGSSVTVVALNGPLNAGDIITLPGCNAVNRVTFADTGQLQQFVVTAHVDSSATSIPIYPAITPLNSGNPVQYATVTASPTTGDPWACVTNASSVFRKNILFRKEAFALVVAPLPTTTTGVVKQYRADYDKCSIRYSRGFDIYKALWVDRLDILYGYATPKPDWACVIADAI